MTRIPYIDPAEICHVELTDLTHLHPDQVESLIGSNLLDDLAWHLPLIDGYPRKAHEALFPNAVAWALLEAGARVAWATLIPSPAAQERQRRHVENGEQWQKCRALTVEAIAERDALRARAERAEAELAKLKAEPAKRPGAKRPEAKAAKCDALKQAIFDTLRRLAWKWPNSELPSSRLWAEMVDRGLVAVVRPGLAAEGEPHRFYRAKEALRKDGHIVEVRGFVRLAPAKAEQEPTFQD